ncbi:hypothetical protein F2Q70_00030087 [Brassica cretica]|uniref:DUF287 domain-containing protein n=1 Tax=Brassica cretica TaxID=69181 RepID=A0A8S9FE65_BRACR|nr:hypothetical protein F2Q70_00030087 [Brassica cretica]
MDQTENGFLVFALRDIILPAPASHGATTEGPKTETPEEPATVTVIDGVLSEPINVLVEVAVTVTSGEENGGEDDVLEDKELESVVEGDKDGDEEDDDDEAEGIEEEVKKGTRRTSLIKPFLDVAKLYGLSIMTETPEEPATVTVIDGVLSEPINVLVEVAVTVTSGEENDGEDDVHEDKELESVVEGDKDGEEDDDDDEVTI